MRFVYLSTAIVLSVLILHSTPSHANEAQAALLSKSTANRYQIPQNLSAEEKSWFKVFQEGNFLSDGWQEISAEILAKTPPDQQHTQRIALENLGKKIGMEWCRPNDVRKVDSAMLQEWGGILKKTARKNPKQLPQAIASIDRKLDAVLK